MRKLLILIIASLLLALQGCNEVAYYNEVSDIEGHRIGVVEGSIQTESLASQFHAIELITYDQLHMLFLHIEAGHCDAAILQKDVAMQVLARNSDYGLLGTRFVGEEELHVVVPRTLIAAANEREECASNWLSNVWARVHRNLFSEEAWRLILGGLYTTIIIFVFAALLAIVLGTLLAYLAINHKWPWFYRPLNWFVYTIHDVPSVVLMMFFYYVLFAGHVNGIFVSIIALGVYTSGSLAKIFKIHILQVGNEQFEAGRVLGLSSRQCYRYIILPQAVKMMLPLLISELKVQLRATSYAGYIAQKDLVKAVDAIRGLTFDAFVPLLAVSVLYLLISWLIAQTMHLVYHKFFRHD